MKPHGWLVSTLLALPVLAGAGELKTQDGIHWEQDYPTALRVAAKQHTDVLVDFYTDWCEWCKVQDDSTLSVPSFVAFSRRYVWVRLDAEKQDSLIAQQYAVKAFPTVVVMNSKGEEYDRVVGYNKPGPFQEQVVDYCAGRNTLKALLAEEPKRNADWAFQAKLADKLFGTGRTEEALARYKVIFIGDVKNESGQAEDAGYVYARTIRREKRYDDALAAYAALLERFPSGHYKPNALFGVALAWEGKGDTSRAISGFERYMKEFPNDSGVADAKKEIESLRHPASKP